MSNLRKKCIGHLVAGMLLVFAIPVAMQAAGIQTVTVKELLKLPDAAPGKDYHVVLKHETYKESLWKKKSGELPKNLALASNGSLVGVIDKKTAAKTYLFEVRVTGKNKKGKELSSSYKLSLKVLPVPKKIKPGFGSTQNLRMVGGYQFSRASSANGDQRGFFDIYFGQPIPSPGKKPNWIWGNLRLTSIPQQNEKNIGAVGPDYFSDLSKLKLNEVADAVELMLGLDITLWRKDNETKNRRYTLGFVCALGAISKQNTTDEEIKKFKISDSFRERYPNEDYSEDPKFVAFVPQESKRFYHQCYAGLRFKTFKLTPGKENEKLAFPSMIEITLGLNNAVSGREGGAVIRFDGFLPVKILNFPMYLFGTVIVNTRKETLTMPLFLDEVGDADKDKLGNKVTLTSPDLLTVAVPETARDFYRIGIGMDLWNLLERVSGKDKKSK